MGLDFSKVIGAVEKKDWSEAILALREVWAENKHPKLAELFEAVQVRVVQKPVPELGNRKAEHEEWLRLGATKDPVLMAGLVATHALGDSGKAIERLEVLEKWSDPLVLSALVHTLSSPGYRAGSAARYFSRMAELLVASKATHFVSTLREIASQYPTIIPTTCGPVYQTRLLSAVKKLEKLGLPPDPGIPERLLGLVKEELAEVQSQKSRARSEKTTEAELLAAVYANPQDDGPRLVYADFLSSKGDIRGEFISVQVQRAVQDSPELETRERELWAELERVAPNRGTGMVIHAALEYLSGELVGLHYGGMVIERGFPARAVVAGLLQEYLGLEAWATVHTLNCKWANEVRLAELVTSPVMRSLESLIEVSDLQLAAIWAIRPLKLKKLRLVSKNISEQARVLLQQCPPDHLFLGGYDSYSTPILERLS